MCQVFHVIKMMQACMRGTAPRWDWVGWGEVGAGTPRRIRKEIGDKLLAPRNFKRLHFCCLNHQSVALGLAALGK